MSTPGSAHEIFAAAADLAPDARGAFLEAKCGTDPHLRARVERLLAALDESSPRPDAPTSTFGSKPTSAPSSGPGEGPGDFIGPYRLLQQIGEGGFGSVFLAEQIHPVQRRVALKIIKLGMDTRLVIARFEAERQALALMDHPNIAKVFDAGATETGRPYFVMELVKGDAITRYCDINNLSIADRLALFSHVCQAVQHAHTKGIIHRDLKPSNILVTMLDGRPSAKVIDFGISKATNSRLTERTLFTEHRQLVGTPEYMSPEQAAGSLDIDTRTDVYSLGVLLYELLTGSTPFDSTQLRSAAYAEIQRIIRETEPPRPSTRLSQSTGTLPSVAAHRHTEPRKLGTLLRGDLDWIVMKCLDKDRQRRYETANGLAMDIQRYLAGQAVIAAPPSSAYRFRKFVRRHRGAVTAAALIAAALVLGVVGTTAGLVNANHQRRLAVAASAAEARQRQLAETERDRAREVADFMSAVLAGAGPAVARGRDSIMLKEMIDAAAARINEGKLKANPAAEISLRRTIGNVYQDVAQYGPAETHLNKAAVLARATFGPDDPSTSETEIDLAEVQVVRGSYAEARILSQRALDALTAHGQGDSATAARAWSILGIALHNLSGGYSKEAEQAHRSALAIRRKVLDPADPLIARSLSNLAGIARARSALKEAEPLAREALDITVAAHGRLHPESIAMACGLADIQYGLSKYTQVLDLLNPVLQDAEKLHGPAHAQVADVLWRLGEATRSMGRPDAAKPIDARCLEIREGLYGDRHKDVFTARASLAADLEGVRDYAAAEPLYRKNLEGRKAVFGAETAVVASSLHDLGECLRSSGKLDQAAAVEEEAITIWKKALPDSPDITGSLYTLAMIRQDEGNLPAAIDLFGQVVELNRKFSGNESLAVAKALANQGSAMFRAGQKKEAEEIFRQATDSARKAGGVAHPTTSYIQGNLAYAMEDRGAFADAEPILRERVQSFRGISPDHPELADALAWVGSNLLKQHRPADALVAYEESVSLSTRLAPDDWKTATFRSGYGEAIFLAAEADTPSEISDRIARFVHHEEVLTTAHADLVAKSAKIPASRRATRLNDAASRIVRLYEAWDKLEPGTGKADKAAPWRPKTAP